MCSTLLARFIVFSKPSISSDGSPTYEIEAGFFLLPEASNIVHGGRSVIVGRER